jgi:creatinine amidohydrolase
MLALAPDLVHDERPVGATQPIDVLLPRLREDGVAAVSENGVLGDARGATAADGQALIERFAAEIGALLESTSNGTAVG